MGLNNDRSSSDNPAGEGKPADGRGAYAFNVTLAAVAGQVGCLTILIIFLSLIAGLWLDSTLGTQPTFTVVLMIASVPVTLAVMFWVVKQATSRMKQK
jgi:hypothetical protein